MDIVYQPVAAKALMKMDRTAARRLRARLQEVAGGQTHKAAKLVNRPGYKVRAGDYRAIVEFDGDVLVVLDAGHRSTIYE